MFIARHLLRQHPLTDLARAALSVSAKLPIQQRTVDRSPIFLTTCLAAEISEHGLVLVSVYDQRLPVNDTPLDAQLHSDRLLMVAEQALEGRSCVPFVSESRLTSPLDNVQRGSGPRLVGAFFDDLRLPISSLCTVFRKATVVVKATGCHVIRGSVRIDDRRALPARAWS